MPNTPASRFSPLIVAGIIALLVGYQTLTDGGFAGLLGGSQLASENASVPAGVPTVYGSDDVLLVVRELIDAA